jgi:hypothetical protein
LRLIIYRDAGFAVRKLQAHYTGIVIVTVGADVRWNGFDFADIKCVVSEPLSLDCEVADLVDREREEANDWAKRAELLVAGPWKPFFVDERWQVSTGRVRIRRLCEEHLSHCSCERVPWD